MASSYNELFGLGSHSEDTDLVGWWPLQEDAASTAVADESSNGNDGVADTNTENLSVSGPTSYLANGFDYGVHPTHNPVVIKDEGPLPALASGDSITLLGWVNADISELNSVLGIYSHGTTGNNPLVTLSLNSSGGVYGYLETDTSDQVVTATDGTAVADETWTHIGIVFDRTTNDEAYRYVNGSHNGGTDTDISAQTGAVSVTSFAYLGAITNQSSFKYEGSAAEMVRFDRALTAAEVAQVYNGPEPVNSVAPAISGTEEVGETLSCTTGTWGLDSPFSSGSNGTVTYAYQWTRSNNGSGSGEADISGATSSTYTLVEADDGKYIRCRVAASNDGGNDSDADTDSDMSGEITGGGGGGTILPFMMQMAG